MTPHFIDTPAALASWAAGLRGSAWLTVDTEFVRVDTYHSRLCLIQVGDAHSAACIDTLALPDLEPLFDLLFDPATLKIFHSASQDLEIFAERCGRIPAPLFDTQIAATLLGLGDQIGYAGLVEKRLGIAVDKSLSRTDWARRPLSAAELAYAADDVRHLATLYPALREELVQAGRLAWLEEDCAALTEPARYLTRPEDAWQRLKGLPRLDATAQAVAAALAGWREAEARSRNRPRKWILDDEPLYALANRRPAHLAELEALQVLPPKTLARHGEALLAVIHGAATVPPPLAPPELDAGQKARLKTVQASLRQRAEELNLPASFLAPRADLEALVVLGDQAPIPLLRGWRREQAGAALLEA
jgi:ribonuclease D